MANELSNLTKIVYRGKRVGRGNASGRGNYSGRGIKGQKARSGRTPRAGFEGGRTPLFRQLPKARGFTGRMPSYQTVTLAEFEAKVPEGATVDRRMFAKLGIIRNPRIPVKLIGNSVAKTFSFHLDDYSDGAREAIQKAGGTILPDKKKAKFKMITKSKNNKRSEGKP
ncbi:MAG: 50S ribosomal protein L15 [Parcubacteria group bacterium]|nr:50S ribosomal protein L15 [Parcubacteria group bacterium]